MNKKDVVACLFSSMEILLVLLGDVSEGLQGQKLDLSNTEDFH